MNNIEEFFIQKVDNISFIELKDSADIIIKDYKLNPLVPLPLIVDELINEIKGNRAQNELKISSIINGIIYSIGADVNFKYNDEYKKILYAFDKDIENYILHKSLKLIEETKIDQGMIYLRALVNLNKNNKLGLFNYGLSLERKANIEFDNNNIKKGWVFLNEATKTFEETLDLDETFSPTYYKLGYHYLNLNQYIKAKLIWEKFIKICDDENLREEIKDNLGSIDDNVLYEEGYNEVLSGNPSKGLEKLLPLKEKYEDWWNLLFMIGLSYRMQGMNNEAKIEFENILKINPNQVDTLNELGLCLVNLGLFEEAIENFSLALELKEDYEILCNRGMTYLQIGKIREASIDINKAYELNPEDEITIACKRELDKVI